MPPRKLLPLLGAVLGSSIQGCSSCDDANGRRFKNPVYLDPDRAEPITHLRFGPEDDFIDCTFADWPLVFKKVGQTIRTDAFQTIRSPLLKEPYFIRYSMNATLTRGYTGGPPGSAMEYGINISDIQPVERIMPPPAAPSARTILPGELIDRGVTEVELENLDDRYRISLPGGGRYVTIFILPVASQYEFGQSVFKDGKTIPRLDPKDVPSEVRAKGLFQFRTDESGVYELAITSRKAVSRTPDKYLLTVYWGSYLLSHGADRYAAITWKASTVIP